MDRLIFPSVPVRPCHRLVRHSPTLGDRPTGLLPTLGMIRSIATWGAELGWRGQKVWEKEFARVQYQALRKITGAISGTAIDKVNRMAGIEDVWTHMDNNQARAVARCIEDPSKLGDIMPRGFGDEGGGVIDDELAAEDGRQWNDHGPRWVKMEGKRDSF